jgi:hypothetical protein
VFVRLTYRVEARCWPSVVPGNMLNARSKFIPEERWFSPEACAG